MGYFFFERTILLLQKTRNSVLLKIKKKFGATLALAEKKKKIHRALSDSTHLQIINGVLLIFSILP